VRRAPFALVALAVGAFSLTAAACQPSLDGIAIADVQRATVTEVVDVPASVTARAIATLTAPADGTLASLDVAPGATVAKDQILAVIDSPTAQQRLAQARSSLAAASRVGGGFRGVDLSRVQDGLDAAAGDAFTAARAAAAKIADEEVRTALLAQVDAAEAHYQSTAAASRSLQRQVQQGIAGIGDAVSALGAAQRAQAQTAVDLAQSTVDSLTLRAPIAGVVQFARPASGVTSDPFASLIGSVAGGSAARTTGGGETVGVDDVLTVGDRVNAGTGVITIIDISEIGLVGEVDETDVLLVSPGITADVELDAAPGLRFGRPSARSPVANSVDPGRRAAASASSPGPQNRGRTGRARPASRCGRGGLHVRSRWTRSGAGGGSAAATPSGCARGSGRASSRTGWSPGRGLRSDRQWSLAGRSGRRRRYRQGLRGPGSSRDRTVAPVAVVDAVRSYELDGVTVPALRGVSLAIDPGEYVAIIGPSGSGKSTLMHLLGGLDRPTSGRLLLGGRDVSTLSSAELARLRNEVIGFVFQSFHLLARTSARDNVALPLIYRGLRRAERRRRAEEMLDRVGLAHRVHHRPNQLSGGEQQRVAIARALVTGPSVLLADEPTGNLDTRTGEAVLELLEELNAERGVALAVVTTTARSRPERDADHDARRTDSDRLGSFRGTHERRHRMKMAEAWRVMVDALRGRRPRSALTMGVVGRRGVVGPWSPSAPAPSRRSRSRSRASARTCC
jgi:putative ABC transport system ATP-binding protein